MDITFSSSGIRSSISISEISVVISVLLSSLYFFFISSSSSFITLYISLSSPRSFFSRAIISINCLCSSFILSLSRPVKRCSLKSSMAWACITVSLKFLTNLSLAVGTSFEELIVFITSSRLSRAIKSPINMCSRSSAFFNSYLVLLTTTLNLCFVYSSIKARKFKVLGTPSVRASIIIPKVSSSWVFLYKELITTFGIVSFLSSITTLIPLLSDSSRRSLIPSIFLVLTSSAIFPIRFDLFTWYGSSVIIIWVLPFFG